MATKGSPRSSKRSSTNAVRSSYHLGLDSRSIEGATIALLPGDPDRVPLLAQTDPIRDAKEIAWKREYRTWLAWVDKTPVLITSTGIGGPSTSIALDELAQLGVETFIRVGTTGAIQADIALGDVIITSGAVRLDGASTHYAPIEYPAVAHYEMVEALVMASQLLNITYHVGITCSSDTFYPGQERKDSFTGYVPRRFQGATEEWRKLHVLNYEMEAATVLTLCNAFGLRGGCVTGVVVRRVECEHITKKGLVMGEKNAMSVAAKALEVLISRER